MSSAKSISGFFSLCVTSRARRWSQNHTPHQWFSNGSLHHTPGRLVHTDLSTPNLLEQVEQGGTRICISHKFPGLLVPVSVPYLSSLLSPPQLAQHHGTTLSQQMNPTTSAGTPEQDLTLRPESGTECCVLSVSMPFLEVQQMTSPAVRDKHPKWLDVVVVHCSLQFSPLLVLVLGNCL
jgi:hypothetical protein